MTYDSWKTRSPDDEFLSEIDIKNGEVPGCDCCGTTDATVTLTRFLAPGAPIKEVEWLCEECLADMN